MADPGAGLAGLAVFVRAGSFVFAFDAAAVDRIVLVDQLDEHARSPSGATRARVGARWYAVRDLAALFGVSAPGAALVLTRLADGTPVAVLVSACLKVAPLPRLTAVPAAVVRGRGDGVRGAFATAGVLGASATAPYGLALQLDRTLGAQDADAIRAELRGGADARGRP